MIQMKKDVNKLFKNKKANDNYIKRGTLYKKLKNSSSFTNIKFIGDDGIINLKDDKVARVYQVNAIDLSLSSNNQKINFYQQLKFLYQIKNLNLRIYKLDDEVNYNGNKDYYNKLLEKYDDDNIKRPFLEERFNEIEQLEDEKLSITSQYFFVIISDNIKSLKHICEEVEYSCYNMTPRLNIKTIINKLEIYKFLINLYGVTASLQQLMWCDLFEIITPSFIKENIDSLQFDDDNIQVVAIKGLPPFIDEGFFEMLFNVPETRCCIHIKDTIPTEELIRRLDNNYEFLISERTMTRKLSDATQMDLEKESFKELMCQIKNGDEKIKEVDFIILLKGDIKEREFKLKELKKIADIYHIKLEVAKMRQYDGFQAFDLNSIGFSDYHQYLPTITLSASFPLTITYFNDETGYPLGIDMHTGLPIVFDMFYRDITRPSSNLAVIASTGGGKSFTLKKIIVNEINRGNKVFIFDAEGEYKDMVVKNNGEYIDLYSKSGGIINPLQVRFLPSDVEEIDNKDVNTLNSEDCPLSKHLSYLETFIKCAFEEIKENEVVILLDMIEKLYNRFGITKNTKISKLKQLENTDYPIFDDLISFVSDYRKMLVNNEQIKILDSVETLLYRFKIGIDYMLFNGYTSVNLNSNLIAFSVKDLLYSKNKRIITTQLVNLLTYLNNIIVGNRIYNENNKNENQNIAVIVDEFHLYLKNTTSEVILTFEQIARRIRKYNGSFVPATQSIHDFIGDDDSLRSATAIFNNCQYQLVGMLKEDDFSTYLKLFYENPLTETQKEFLSNAKQGEFLLTIDHYQKLRLKITANQMELLAMLEDID